MVGRREDTRAAGSRHSFSPPAGRSGSTARKVPKGSRLVFEVHDTPSGKAGTDRSAVGLVLAKHPPRREAKGTAAFDKRFVIPAGATGYDPGGHRAEFLRLAERAKELGDRGRRD